jgi:lysophospholipase L1-like esterase
MNWPAEIAEGIDTIHPSAQGYEVWAKALEPILAKLLGEK